MEKLTRHFADFATFSAEEKTAISIRDGVLEYYGEELGLEPADKIFTVYRSPATIANAAYAMVGVPVTDEHIVMDAEAPNTGSKVCDAIVIDQIDDYTKAKLAVRNRLSIADTMMPLLESKRQLSLGYKADLIPHESWDFEQVDIIPHHLAVVPSGRCGQMCSFLDRKPAHEDNKMPKLNKAFCDAEGAVSLEQIVEIATALPEAIRKVPVDKLQELMPAMLEVVSYAKEQNAVTDEELVSEDKTVVSNEELEDMAKEKEGYEDSAKFKDAVAALAKKESVKLADAEVKRYSEAVNKAKNFLDENYDYSGKDANTIMRDALATEHGETEFSDSELGTAFKLLKKSAPDYTQFGDSKPDNGLAARVEKDLEG